MTAKEALEISNAVVISPEVLTKIRKAAETGNRHAYIDREYITDRDIRWLKENGYSVEWIKLYDEAIPVYAKVEW